VWLLAGDQGVPLLDFLSNCHSHCDGLSLSTGGDDPLPVTFKSWAFSLNTWIIVPSSISAQTLEIQHGILTDKTTLVAEGSQEGLPVPESEELQLHPVISRASGQEKEKEGGVDRKQACALSCYDSWDAVLSSTGKPTVRFYQIYLTVHPSLRISSTTTLQCQVLRTHHTMHDHVQCSLGLPSGQRKGGMTPFLSRARMGRLQELTSDLAYPLEAPWSWLSAPSHHLP